MNILLKLSDWLSIPLMILVLSINLFNIETIFGYKIPVSGEFWLILFVLIFTIFDKTPVKWKNICMYYWTKVKPFGRKYFNFKMIYAVAVENISENIFTELKEKVENYDSNATFTKNSEILFLYNNTLEVEIHKDIEHNTNHINFSILKDNYTIGALEKDLEYYSKLINKFKELFVVQETSVSYNLSINSFYTPNYLLRKFYDDKKEFNIKIGQNIDFKKNGDIENIHITGTDIDTAKEDLKNYLNLSL